MSTLFSDITVKDLNIKNRIVMAPMVVFEYANEEGFVTKEHIAHYEERAKNGVGLIIIEACCVSAKGKLADVQLGIWSDAFISGLSKIAAACHKHGAKVIVQIHHAGIRTPEVVSKDIVGPSDMFIPSSKGDKKSSARALTLEELHSLQNDFVMAAQRAEIAGFDGIELHGAHGYLVNQFFAPSINQRDDLYGGNLISRARFATEIITEIRKRVDKHFIIGCRMGGNEPDLETSITLAKLLEQAGVDLLHISAGSGQPNAFSENQLENVHEGIRLNWIIASGIEIRKHVNIPTIVVFGIKQPHLASYLIENGLADFVAIGKGLLVDPHWAQKAADGGSIAPCLGCKKCSWMMRSKALCPGICAL